jgi:O-methyltransferase
MKPDLIAAFNKCGVDNPESDVLPYCLLSNARLKGIVYGLDASRNVSGLSAEIGCAAGGTSFLIASYNKNRKHIAVDTFEGLVDAGEQDPDLWNGQFSADSLTFEAVKERLSVLGNVEVIKGYFPDCYPLEARFSFVHIDTDTYQSMRTCIDWFIPRMNKGGVIVMDDVIGNGTVGGKKAWAETDKSRLTILQENDKHVIVRVT